MWGILAGILTGLVGSLLGRVLVGGGLALVTFAALNVLVNTLLDVIYSYMSGLPSQVAALIALSGLGTGLSLLGGAFLTRAALAAASVGLKKAAG